MDKRKNTPKPASAPQADEHPSADMAVAKAVKAFNVSQARADASLDNLLMRLYVAKCQARAAHALADAEDQSSDIALILDAISAELQAIADGMGEFLPLRSFRLPEAHS